MMDSRLTKEWLQTTIAEYELRLRDLPPYLDTNSRIELEAFKLALSVLEAAPDGWQLVPKEITVDMECAISTADSYSLAWKRALAVAPKCERTKP
ncbi:hypothetical protein JGT32_19340 [Enterobacter hormaechei]|uniref:hypothetical protein n=1 Tax=Enterobacteriaceae TaxID=543 RepID=UPI000792F1F0|nr:hypothetical protein [Enterobacter hormaechei]MBF1958596.1 hypothetical protein [Klebsiella pneumoniae]ELJ9635958.1 hypothetical protein [Enterobacter hormaechei]MBF9267792.1 hypothetical protein [Enterobacter hormaechei]MBJ6511610.1 hypothetical protein [Enterobacter hormaechei]MBJ6608060.1 hypothetical protein [Enterobacter hormaechei]